jgi:hypothetical protein
MQVHTCGGGQLGPAVLACCFQFSPCFCQLHTVALLRNVMPLITADQFCGPSDEIFWWSTFLGWCCFFVKVCN